MAKMKTLVIFDFDDTLFRSDSCVKVHNAFQAAKHLTSHEYAGYVPDPHDVFDYSEFNQYPKNPQPIPEIIQQLQFSVKKYGPDNVIILSARGNSEPIRQVLIDFSLPNIFVAAIDSSNPAQKGIFARRTVEEENYQRVIVFEDSIKNIYAIMHSLQGIVSANAVTGFHVSNVNGKNQVKRIDSKQTR